MTKHLDDKARVLGFAIVVLVLAGLAAAGFAVATPAQASPASQATTTVAIAPASVELACGETKVVDIRINDVADLYGADVRVSYDPALVEVVDANAAAPGVQIQPGDMPDVSGGQGLVQVNSVDVDAGTISYAAIRLNPAPAQSGSGIIASATFRGKAGGTSPVVLVTVLLSTPTANPIPSVPVNGEIVVNCDQTAVPTVPSEPTEPTSPATGQPTAVPTYTPVVPQPTSPPGGTCRHVVKPGETLYSIAQMYGVTVDAIMKANGITNPDLIYAGQTLIIPGCTQPPPPVTQVPVTPGPVTPGPKPPWPPSSSCKHVVRPGETLYSIARTYGTTVPALQAANGITNPNLIFAGQTLVVPNCRPGPKPPPSGTCFAYTVKPGDTLSGIAMATGDCVAQIAYRNGLVNPNLIFAGQVLQVCPGCSGGGPGPGPLPPKCRATHTVKPYETLIRIALMYGSSVQAIQAANNIANPNLIYAGQQLCIP